MDSITDRRRQSISAPVQFEELVALDVRAVPPEQGRGGAAVVRDDGHHAVAHTHQPGLPHVLEVSIATLASLLLSSYLYCLHQVQQSAVGNIVKAQIRIPGSGSKFNI